MWSRYGNVFYITKMGFQIFPEQDIVALKNAAENFGILLTNCLPLQFKFYEIPEDQRLAVVWMKMMKAFESMNGASSNLQ